MLEEALFTVDLYLAMMKNTCVFPLIDEDFILVTWKYNL